MIIKIDHITICSTDFESDLNYFSNLGFKPSILNRKLIFQIWGLNQVY